MDQIVDFERRIELALDEIERFVSEYSISPSLKTERDNDRLQDLAAENQLLTAQIESLKTQHNNELQALIAEREEERETVKSLYKRLTEVVESSAMDSYLIDESRKLHVCGSNPDCDGYEVEQGQFRIKGYDGPVIECDKCGADMQLKTGRFGKYFGCTESSCTNTRKLLRSGEAAPPKMDPVPMPELQCAKVEDHYVLRDGASGIFLAASQFPRHRETRPPFVDELLPHQAEIDPKHHYLFDAPRIDDQGNRSQIRYSRKTKEQYVMSERDGKPSGWRALFADGRWVEEGSAKKAKAKRKAKPKTKSKAKAKAKAKPVPKAETSEVSAADESAD